MVRGDGRDAALKDWREIKACRLSKPRHNDLMLLKTWLTNILWWRTTNYVLIIHCAENWCMSDCAHNFVSGWPHEFLRSQSWPVCKSRGNDFSASFATKMCLKTTYENLCQPMYGFGLYLKNSLVTFLQPFFSRSAWNGCNSGPKFLNQYFFFDVAVLRTSLHFDFRWKNNLFTCNNGCTLCA